MVIVILIVTMFGGGWLLGYALGGKAAGVPDSIIKWPSTLGLVVFLLLLAAAAFVLAMLGHR